MVTRNSRFFGAFSSSDIDITVYSDLFLKTFLFENVQQAKPHNVSIKDLGTLDPFRLEFGHKNDHLAVFTVIKVLLKANYTEK